MGESLRLELEFDDDARAEIEISTLTEKRRWLSVQGRKATAIYDDLSATKLTLSKSVPGAASGDAGTMHAVPFTMEPPLTVAIREFALGVRRGQVELSSLEMGVDVVRILALCEQSMETDGR